MKQIAYVQPHAEDAAPCTAQEADSNRLSCAYLDPACVRAAREDDDGYDPYSDRVVIEPMFERDPWD